MLRHEASVRTPPHRHWESHVGGAAAMDKRDRPDVFFRYSSRETLLLEADRAPRSPVADVPTCSTPRRSPDRFREGAPRDLAQWREAVEQRFPSSNDGSALQPPARLSPLPRSLAQPDGPALRRRSSERTCNGRTYVQLSSPTLRLSELPTSPEPHAR